VPDATRAFPRACVPASASSEPVLTLCLLLANVAKVRTQAGMGHFCTDSLAFLGIPGGSCGILGTPGYCPAESTFCISSPGHSRNLLGS
jgi:hypothetical protein